MSKWWQPRTRMPAVSGRSGPEGAAWQAALRDVLHPFEGYRRGFATECLDYVLTGSPGITLIHVSGWELSRGVLSVDTYGGGGPGAPARRRLYAALADMPPKVAVRWARLLEHAWGRDHLGLVLGEIAQGRFAEVLLVHIGRTFQPGHGPWTTGSVPVAIQTLESVVEAGGGTQDDLVLAAFRTAIAPGFAHSVIPRLRGYDDSVERSAPAIIGWLDGATPAERVAALGLLGEVSPAALSAYAAWLTRHACTGTAPERAAATALVIRMPDEVGPLLRALTQSPQANTRAHALTLIWGMAPDSATRTWARRTAAADQAAAVRALATKWRRAARAVEASEDPSEG